MSKKPDSGKPSRIPISNKGGTKPVKPPKAPLRPGLQEPKPPGDWASTFRTVPKRVYNFGERDCGFHIFGCEQVFSTLKKENLKHGTLFVDDQFNYDVQNISKLNKDVQYTWKRPHEIVRTPKFIADGMSRFDVKQGQISNCWLIAAFAALTLSEKQIVDIVPTDQCFEKHYAGIFHFRLWHFGKWIDVCVDDQLLCHGTTLAFCKSTDQNEFWGPLLEKAYAKLEGGYEYIQHGRLVKALQNLTGGISAEFLIKSDQSIKMAEEIIMQAYSMGSFIGAHINPAGENPTDPQPKCGLVQGHGYTITKLAEIEYPPSKSTILLVRVRNPWGNSFEWTGAWSDNSPEWGKIPKTVLTNLQVEFNRDGEYWMNFQDFVKYFDAIIVCNLTPDLLINLEKQEKSSVKKEWHIEQLEGEWIPGITSGPMFELPNRTTKRKMTNKYDRNPQYTINLRHDDHGTGKCHLYLQVMVKHGFRYKTAPKDETTYNPSMGLAVFACNETMPKPLPLEFLKQAENLVASSFSDNYYSNLFAELLPGMYCIIPSMLDSTKEGGEYILRIFSEQNAHLSQYDAEVEYKGIVVEEVAVPYLVDKKNLDQLFDNMAEGPAHEISWWKLQNLLNEYLRHDLKGNLLDKDICQSMIALVDYDKSGKLSLYEFEKLMGHINNWKHIFRRCDPKKSGFIAAEHLDKAFRKEHCVLNKTLLNLIMHRFGNEKLKIEFDDFIMCSIRLFELIDRFKRISENNKAKLNINDWIETNMYC